MTTLGSTGQIKDPVFPEEPERNNAREQSLIKRGQICWNGQSSQVCYLLRRDFAYKRRGIVCCHRSSSFQGMALDHFMEFVMVYAPSDSPCCKRWRYR